MIKTLATLFRRNRVVVSDFHCKRCRRILKTADAIAVGFGATCWAKAEMENNLNLFEGGEYEKDSRV